MLVHHLRRWLGIRDKGTHNQELHGNPGLVLYGQPPGLLVIMVILSWIPVVIVGLTTWTWSEPWLCLDWGVVSPVNTKHLNNICTMLDQRLRRWSNIVQMLYKCFVCWVPNLSTVLTSVIRLPYHISKHKTLNQCWFNAGPASSTEG